MGICGVELTAAEVTALGTFAFAVASELIGRSKLKQNGVVAVVVDLLGSRVKALTPAHTPKATGRKAPHGDSPAKPRRGRPTKPAPSSKT